MGGLLEPPFFVTDRDEPYRPGLVVWMDARDGLVVGQDVVAPEQADGAVARTLLDAMERPLGGPPRRPDRIRVADAATAAELRAALGDAMPIRIAPTPELDELLRSMLESMPAGDEPESYLEAGRVSLAALAELFRAADALYRFAPWRVATDDRVLRLDIPELGVEGACVSIIGYLGESLGLLVFPSLAGYEAFGRAAERHAHGRDPIDLGTDWLALNFERGADLPAAMRREVSDHRWPVADASAYPRVQRIERDGALRPIVERDVKIASACASSLVVFFAKHRRLFESEAFEPVCESTFDERDLEVRFTLPYEAYGLFDVQDAPRSEASARPRVGRNDPCPCGSGRKYKKCHLALDRAESDPQGGRAREHDLDGKIVRELGEYAMRRFGSEWLRFANDFVDSSETPGLAVPWSVYQYEVQGQSVAGWYLEERGRRMSGAERGWLAAQRAAWLSVWEVVGVEPGETVTLRDLLSNQERCVREASASESVVLRDAMLARVVDQGGISLLCGMHPRLLPPLDAAEVVRRARGRLRRRRAVPVERLREEGFGRYLIGRWEETVFDLDRRAATPPDLRNTDGDPLLLTTDHFEIEPSARAALESRLAGLEGAGAGGPEQNFAVYDFMHPVRENTLVGRALVSDVELRLETNSRERADALRGRVEAACGGLLRHRAREHADPLSPALSARAPGPPAEDLPPEAGQLLLDIKRRHYAGWPDEALPALGGLSPREAVRTSQGRNAVDVLLKDLENHEQRFEGPDAFDFGELRRELRLDR